MNYIYNFETTSISQKKEPNLKTKSQPSDMVLRNILNYSKAFCVMKNRTTKGKTVENIQLILN